MKKPFLTMCTWILLFTAVAATKSRAEDPSNVPGQVTATQPSQTAAPAPAPEPVQAPAPTQEEMEQEPMISPFYTSGAQRLSLQGGVGIPTSVNNLTESQKPGPTGGIQFLHQHDDYWAYGVQVDLFKLPAKDRLNTSPAGGVVNLRTEDEIATAEVLFRYHFQPAARFVPYFQGGVGATYFRQTAEGEPAPGSIWTDTSTTETRSLQDSKSVNFALSGGFGVETALSSRLILGLETIWHLFGVNETTFGTQGVNLPTVGLRFGWRLN